MTVSSAWSCLRRAAFGSLSCWHSAHVSLCPSLPPPLNCFARTFNPFLSLMRPKFCIFVFNCVSCIGMYRDGVDRGTLVSAVHYLHWCVTHFPLFLIWLNNKLLLCEIVDNFEISHSVCCCTPSRLLHGARPACCRRLLAHLPAVVVRHCPQFGQCKLIKPCTICIVVWCIVSVKRQSIHLISHWLQVGLGLWVRCHSRSDFCLGRRPPALHPRPLHRSSGNTHRPHHVLQQHLLVRTSLLFVASM